MVEPRSDELVTNQLLPSADQLIEALGMAGGYPTCRSALQLNQQNAVFVFVKIHDGYRGAIGRQVPGR